MSKPQISDSFALPDKHLNLRSAIKELYGEDSGVIRAAKRFDEIISGGVYSL
jgi:hypothetical protein